MKYPHFLFKIFNEKGKELSLYSTYRKQRFLTRLRARCKGRFKVFIRVRYAKGFYNEGEYTNLKDTLFAFRAFTDKSLIEEFKK